MNARWLIALYVTLAFGYASDALFGVGGSLPVPALVAALALAIASERTLHIDVRDGMYFCAPLYGRQLARAHSLVAVAGALAFPVGAALHWAANGTLLAEIAPGGLALPLIAACALASVVALSATLRGGASRAGYAFMAIAAGGLTLTPHFVHEAGWAPLGSLAVAAVMGFFALRAFGETLARYDPVGV
jgi:hypothetical protein